MHACAPPPAPPDAIYQYMRALKMLAPPPPLVQLLLRDLEDAGASGRLERRWGAVLGHNSWTEVLRRYVMGRAGT